MIEPIFSLTRNGKTLILDEPEYGVTDYSGLEATDYDLEKTVNTNYIGERLKRKKILSRPISISADWLGRDEEKSAKRQELIAFFSPFSSGTLTVNYMGVERTIEYEVESFKINTVSLHETLDFQVDLICMDPMFQDVLQTGDSIATWIRGWKWKFTLPFKMKERGEPQKNIINTGHVETPVEIYFHGPAVNPSIKNITTGETIRIIRELTTDDVLYINTGFRQKKVEIIRNGTRTDAFDYIDLSSRFFSLQVGDNVIEYASENGLAPQNVEIYYKNRYLGV
jgi:hypothetical protein